MSELRTLGRAQSRQLQDFRSSEEARLLSRLAQTECLLDLAKLPGIPVNLASYTGFVVGIITQFIPTKCCAISIAVSEVPAISSSYGPVPDDPPAECRHVLELEGEVVGTLLIVPEVVHLSPPQFIAQIAEQVSANLGVLVSAERLRRQEAVVQLIHSIEVLADQPSTDDLYEIVNALASLPNALGARLDIAHAVIGGALSLSAGAPPEEEPEVVFVPGGSIAVGVHWASTAAEEDRESIAEVVSLITIALGRAGERQELRDQAETDPLTGVGNRRRAMRALSAAVGLAEQTDDHVGVIYLDLDYFKRVNDSFGHDVGDKVLVAFAAHLERTVRAYDTVNRLGGEEFLIVCPGLDEVAGETLALRIVEATPSACEEALPGETRQTASAGVACYPFAAQHGNGLIQAADKALYTAKNGGRNQVSVASRLPRERAS